MKHKVFLTALLALRFPNVQPLPLPVSPALAITQTSDEQAYTYPPKVYQETTIHPQTIYATKVYGGHGDATHLHHSTTLGDGSNYQKGSATRTQSLIDPTSTEAPLNMVSKLTRGSKTTANESDRLPNHRRDTLQSDSIEGVLEEGDEEGRNMVADRRKERVAEQNITITILCPICPGNPAKLGGEFSPTNTINRIRERVQNLLDGITFRLVFQDRILTNETKTLEEVGILEGAVLALTTTWEKQDPIEELRNITLTLPIEEPPLPTTKRLWASKIFHFPSPVSTSTRTLEPELPLPAKINLTIVADITGQVYKGRFSLNDTFPFVRQKFGIGSAAEGIKLIFEGSEISDGHTIYQAGIGDSDRIILVNDHGEDLVVLSSSILTLAATSTVLATAVESNPIITTTSFSTTMTTVANSITTTDGLSITTVTPTITMATTMTNLTTSTKKVTSTITTTITITIPIPVPKGPSATTIANLIISTAALTITSTTVASYATVLTSLSTPVVTPTMNSTTTMATYVAGIETSNTPTATVSTRLMVSSAPMVDSTTAQDTTITSVTISGGVIAPEPSSTEIPSQDQIMITFTSIYFVWTGTFTTSSTIRSLKQALGAGTGINWENLVLVFKNRPLLDDDKTLQMFGIRKGEVLAMGAIYATSTVYETVFITAIMQPSSAISTTSAGLGTSTSTPEPVMTRTSVTSTSLPLLLSTLSKTPNKGSVETSNLKSSLRLPITLASKQNFRDRG